MRQIVTRFFFSRARLTSVWLVGKAQYRGVSFPPSITDSSRHPLFKPSMSPWILSVKPRNMRLFDPLRMRNKQLLRLRLPISPKVFSFLFEVLDALTSRTQSQREERGSKVVEKATAAVVQEGRKFQKLFAGICIMRQEAETGREIKVALKRCDTCVKAVAFGCSPLWFLPSQFMAS